jgi:hypothetical protein
MWVLATLVGAMEPRQEDATPDARQRMLADCLRDSTRRAEFESLRTEMFERFAPATEGPIVNPGLRRRGRLVFDDATE